MDLPEPMRLAASASMAAVVIPRLKTTAMSVSRRFMTIPLKKQRTMLMVDEKINNKKQYLD
jgi:hypothetical protein